MLIFCVKGKTSWGKQVVLPMHMVSAYSTSNFGSKITVATSSGVTKFALIKNYAEIGNILSQKIAEKQSAPTPATLVAPATTAQGSSLDDLAKLKALLDSGIISQEEFEAKKKEILGL